MARCRTLHMLFSLALSIVLQTVCVQSHMCDFYHCLRYDLVTSFSLLFFLFSVLPLANRSTRSPARCPPGSSWLDERTCTPGQSVSRCPSETPGILPVSATLCHGYVLCSSPWQGYSPNVPHRDVFSGE